MLWGIVKMEEKKPNIMSRFIRRVRRNRTWKCIEKEWCELEFSNKMIVIIYSVLFLMLVLAVFWYPEGHWGTVSSTFRSVFGGITGYIIGGMGSSEDASKTLVTPDKEDIFKASPSAKCELSPEDCEPESLILPGTTYIRTAIAGIFCVTSILAVFFAILFGTEMYQEGLIRIMDLVSTTIGFLISNASRKK